MIRERIDKALRSLSAQVVDISNYVIIMSMLTIEKFLSELKDISGYRDIEGIIKYKGHPLVSDIIMIDDQVCIMNWDDYAREKDKFNTAMGLHL